MSDIFKEFVKALDTKIEVRFSSEYITKIGNKTYREVAMRWDYKGVESLVHDFYNDAMLYDVDFVYIIDVYLNHSTNKVIVWYLKEYNETN